MSTLPYPVSLVGENFFASWAAFGATALLAVALTSGPLFYLYYWPTQVRVVFISMENISNRKCSVVLSNLFSFLSLSLSLSLSISIPGYCVRVCV